MFQQLGTAGGLHVEVLGGGSRRLSFGEPLQPIISLSEHPSFLPVVSNRRADRAIPVQPSSVRDPSRCGTPPSASCLQPTSVLRPLRESE